MNINPRKTYVVSWLEYETGTRPYGGGGWSKKAKYRPAATRVTKTLKGSQIVQTGKTWTIGGVRKLKFDLVEKVSGLVLRKDY